VDLPAAKRHRFVITTVKEKETEYSTGHKVSAIKQK